MKKIDPDMGIDRIVPLSDVVQGSVAEPRFRTLLLTAFAMEQKVCTVDMLDEVCKDMRLDWPGSRRARNRVAEEFERTPYKV